MRSHVGRYRGSRHLAAGLCVLSGCGFGVIVAAEPARAVVVIAGGHRFGVAPRGDAQGPQQADALVVTSTTTTHAASTTTSTTTHSATSASSATTSTTSTTTHSTATSSATTTAHTTSSTTSTATQDTATSTTTPSSSTSTTSTPVTASTTLTTTTVTTQALTLQYHGGPVIRAHGTYAVYWDPNGTFPTGFESGVNRYLQDVATDSGSPSNEFSVLTQYSDSSGPGTYDATFGGSVIDANPYPADEGAEGCALAGSLPEGYTACLTDQQIQAELSALIAENGWPDSAGAIYTVLLPPGVDECFAGPDGNSQNDGCADSASANPFCSYHSYFGNGQPPLYTVMPWADVSGCQTGESPNGTGGDDPLDDELSLLSHETSETITDPYGTSWYDAIGDEVADGCTDPDQFGPLSGVDPDQYNEILNGDDYILQEDFSNEGASCRARYVAHFTVPTKPLVGHTAAFDASSSSDQQNIAGYSWDFGDGTSGSGVTPSHTYAVPGVYTVTLTTTDRDGMTDSVRHPLAVSTVIAQFVAPPQANVAQVVTFSGSPSLGSVTSYSWDFGDGSTATGETVTHAYSEARNYNVTLTVSDKAGDENTIAQAVTVGDLSTPSNNAQTNPDQGASIAGDTGATPSDIATGPTTSGITATTTTTTTASAIVVAPPTNRTMTPTTSALHASIARSAAVRIVVSGTRAVVRTGETLSCPLGVTDCIVAVTLVHVASQAATAGKSAHSVALTLSSERLVIAAGHHVVIDLTLRPSAINLLRSTKRLRADLEVVASATGGASTARVLGVTLAAPRGL